MISVVVLFFLAYVIELGRYHWLSFDELPPKEQNRLLDEAKKHPVCIGGRTFYPDPTIVEYYTKIKHR